MQNRDLQPRMRYIIDRTAENKRQQVKFLDLIVGEKILTFKGVIIRPETTKKQGK